MQLHELISVLDSGVHINLFVNGVDNASVDTDYLRKCMQMGDERARYKVTCVTPTVFNHWSGNSMPVLSIYVVH